VKAVFDHADHLSGRVVTFWFTPERKLRFEPGQFVEIRLPHTPTDDRGESREFSISSSPDEELVAITMNFAPENGSTYKKAVKALKPGDEVLLAEPMGDFVLPKDTSIPLVFVAAGVGSSPYASMVIWLKSRNEKRNIHLIYSASQNSDFLYNALWESYPMKVTRIITRPDKAWEGPTGRLTVDRLLDFIQPLQNKLVYLAGPQSLIEPLYNDLLAAGLPRSQLLLDYFSGY
jgi:ferredoxin-NADP reductase